MNRISFVLPVTLQEEGSGLGTWRQAPEEGFPLRIALLLESFLRMFRQEDVADFFLVCPEKDIEKNPSPATSAIESSRSLKSVRKSRQ